MVAADLFLVDRYINSSEWSKVVIHGEARPESSYKFHKAIFGNAVQVILPTASGVSNEGPRSRVLVLAPAVSWPWVPAWGSLEPPRRAGENAQKNEKQWGRNGRDTA